jgi:hypothetical protein
MGAEDLPVIFRYITRLTKYKKIALIAHQEGTTQVFSAIATRPDFFKERVSLFVALAPVTKLAHTESELIKFVG